MQHASSEPQIAVACMRTGATNISVAQGPPPGYGPPTTMGMGGHQAPPPVMAHHHRHSTKVPRQDIRNPLVSDAGLGFGEGWVLVRVSVRVVTNV